MSEGVAKILYGILGILALGIGALCVEVGRGTVPIPQEYAWLVPVILPMLVAVSAKLRQLGESGAED